ncbi:MAG: transcriptional regulator, AraC family [Clostridiales bacterium]|nr:transcriptional regulator, AraC family [Clostridiales bacterium]
MQNLSLLEFTKKGVLLKILETFNSSTDLTAIIVDLEGNPIIMNENPLESCRFCKIIRNNPKARQRCSESYARAGKLAATIGEPYIFRCPAGLVEWATPILFEGQHLGTIICGQVLMWEPEDFFWIELTMMNKQFNIDMAELISAAQELPVISGKKVQAAADLLFMIANHIIKTSIISMDQRKKVERQNILLEEDLKLRRIFEVSLNWHNSNTKSTSYSIKKENELLSKIRLGNKQQVLAVLEDILTQLQKEYLDNVEILRMRVLELLVIISRAVIEKGAKPEKILELNCYYTKELSNLQSPKPILSCMPIIVEQYMSLAENPESKNSQIVKQATEYIQQNYHHNLKLENIADAVFLSPYYLSHIFKEETGHTVLEYLTKIRIEEAKKLLRNSQTNVKEVAYKVGYNNPSYFSKLFRNIEGVTPSQFRERLMV